MDLMAFSDAWLLLPVGMVAGLLAGLFGVGGGLVIVPTLFYFLQHLGMPPGIAMPAAVSTSLCSIIPTSVSSATSHWRLGNIDKVIVKLWVVPLLTGVVIGAALISSVQGKGFAIVFGVMLLSVACHKTFKKKSPSEAKRVLSIVPHACTAFVIGFVSVIAGVGGGATGVPALVYMGTPIHKAIGTCALFGFLIALPGCVIVLLFSQTPPNAPPGFYKQLYWPALVLLLPATMSCAPLGAWLSGKLSEKRLNQMFILILFIIGARMFISGVWS